MTEQRFNKIFNAFIFGGMLFSVLVATVMKFDEPGAKTGLLVLAAGGAVMGVCNALFCANGSILSFIFGVVNVSITCVLMWDSGVMGNFALHLLYFLPMQFIGWWQWKKRAASPEKGTKVKARRLGWKNLLWIALAYVAGVAVLFWVLLRIDLAKGLEPDYLKIGMDAAIVGANIVGQVLLSLAFMDQWFFWIVVDICSVILWARVLGSQAGATYAIVSLIKYSFYLLNAFNGLRIWLRLSAPASPASLSEPDSER